jgi:dipeptidyl aminopeptidase/acylaminoacyl peptidase
MHNSRAQSNQQGRRAMRRLIPALLLAFGFCTSVHAQTNSPVQPPDYGQWESLAVSREFGGLSPDGKWIAYGINRSNRDNELRVTNIADGTTKTAAFGTQAAFSSDSRWVAYAIGYSEAQEEKMKKDKKPVQRKLGLLNLSTGEQIVVEGIESFSFSPTGTYLAMRRYAPEKKDAPDAAAYTESDDTPGATLILRQLSSGHDTSFGNVSEFAWQDLPRRGTLLAMATNSEDKTGNGVQLFNSENASVRVLDSSNSVYSRLAWRKDGADLAVFRSKSDEHREGVTQVALAWTHLGESSEANHAYDPTADAKFPAGMRAVVFQKPSWSEDGETVFFGIAKWEEKIPEPKKSTSAAEGDSAKTGSASKDKDKAKEPEEQATVDVWNAHDAEVMPKQKLNAKNDRQKNMLCAWHLQNGQFVQLGRDLDEEVVPFKYQQTAYAANWSAYAMERSIGRPAADIYFVDLATGNRTKIQDRLNDDYYLEASPAGHYLLYFHDNNYWTVNTAARAVVNITKTIPAAFADLEADYTIKQKPAFGFAGWTKDDASIILYDKFDLWQVSPDGSHATKLTDGAADQVRHRYVKLNPRDEFIDTDKPMYLSMFGIWTKKSGYARLNPDASGKFTEEHLIWQDKSVNQLGKAKDAEVFEYVVQTFTESPNAFVGGPNLKDPKQVTKTNPFQSNYAWGKAELIDYKNSHGEHLQGALYYPAGYDPSKKYPMVVYMYEKLSDGLHQYSPPSERNYYNVVAVTSHGYFMLEPDIVFRPRDPGVSVVDCVTSAVKRVIQMNIIDPKKVGVMGHSWGGFDSVYLATHTTDFFAAAVAGAPITDLVSNYGNHHWSSGIAETDHIETGQQRMEVPLYEDLQAYIRNSAVFGVQNMTTPLLIEVGDSDGTVFFHQGVELYNIARRAKKNVVLLEYAGEDHGLRKKPNQIDYQRRIFAWFGHYLKDEPAAAWITNGESYLDRERELKQLKAGEGKD